jgi:hypothetical protein
MNSKSNNHMLEVTKSNENIFGLTDSEKVNKERNKISGNFGGSRFKI